MAKIKTTTINIFTTWKNYEENASRFVPLDFQCCVKGSSHFFWQRVFAAKPNHWQHFHLGCLCPRAQIRFSRSLPPYRQWEQYKWRQKRWCWSCKNNKKWEKELRTAAAVIILTREATSCLKKNLTCNPALIQLEVHLATEENIQSRCLLHHNCNKTRKNLYWLVCLICAAFFSLFVMPVSSNLIFAEIQWMNEEFEIVCKSVKLFTQN